MTQARLRELLQQLQEELDQAGPAAGFPRTATPGTPERAPLSVKALAESWIGRVRRLPTIRIAPHSYRMPSSVDAMVSRLCERHSIAKGDMVAFLLCHAVATFEPHAVSELDLPDPIPAPYELEVFTMKGRLARVVSLRPDDDDRELVAVGRRPTGAAELLAIREDGKLSGRHFALYGSAAGLRVADLDSTNGTYLSLDQADDVAVTAGEAFLLISRERTLQITLDHFDEATGEGRLLLLEDGATEPRPLPFFLTEGQHLPLGDVLRARRGTESVSGSSDMAREEENLLVRLGGRLAFLPPAHGIDEVFAGSGQVLFRRLAPGDGEVPIEPGRYLLAGNSLFRIVRTAW